MTKSKPNGPRRAWPIALIGLLAASAALAGSITVYDDQAAFQEATGATAVPIPLAEELLPAFGLPGWGCDAAIRMPVGPANLLTVTAPFAIPDGTLPGIPNPVCVSNADNPASGSMPMPMSPTIFANGEDDYEMVFDQPVHAIGLELLTSGPAIEGLEFRDELGNPVFAINVGPLTQPNSFEFVGFVSPMPVRSVFVDTLLDRAFNEGISGIFVSETLQDCEAGDPGDLDEDQDGFPASEDCDDGNPTTYPGAPEVCNGVSDDCDRWIDEGFDLDGDDFSVCAGDCDDGDPSVNPDAIDLPGNQADENCDGVLVCDPCADWSNHAHFLHCVIREVGLLIESDRISRRSGFRVINTAFRERVGRDGQTLFQCDDRP